MFDREPYDKISAAARVLGNMLYWTDEHRRGHVDDAELGRRLRPFVDKLNGALFPEQVASRAGE